MLTHQKSIFSSGCSQNGQHRLEDLPLRKKMTLPRTPRAVVLGNQMENCWKDEPNLQCESVNLDSLHKFVTQIHVAMEGPGRWHRFRILERSPLHSPLGMVPFTFNLATQVLPLKAQLHQRNARPENRESPQVGKPQMRRNLGLPPKHAPPLSKTTAFWDVPARSGHPEAFSAPRPGAKPCQGSQDGSALAGWDLGPFQP